MTTDELDRIVHEAMMERGAYPSPLNYFNFPKSVCTSINEVGRGWGLGHVWDRARARGSGQAR